MALVDLNDSVIAQVRSAADIVDFVSQVTPLKLAGKSYKGLCPFHREKTPSFHVDRDKGLFYCFGCGTGGDVFKFLTLTERFTFPEAVEHVAARVGIELPRRKTRSAREDEKDNLLEVIDDASEAFHQALGFPDNAATRYLHERGVPKEIVQKYGFGYAPDAWDYILRRLSGKHGEKKLEKAGLITPRKEKTGYYDRFRNRLMIPIHTETGALAGFGGRSLDGSDPKYLNSPESEIFNKSRLLYNLHRSKDAMRKIDRAILVEGYFDAIAIDHKGVPGVVASMGTSLTSGQASLLRRFTRRVVICYDGDDAGRHATLRAAPVLLSAGLHVEVLDLLGEKDPDTLVQRQGVDRFLELLGNATDIFQFGLKEWGSVRDTLLSTQERMAKVEQFIPLIAAIPDRVAQNFAAETVSQHFRIGVDSVLSRVRGKASQFEPVQRVADKLSSTTQKTILAAAIAGNLPHELIEQIKPAYFTDESCRLLFEIMQPNLLAGTVDVSSVASRLRGERELSLLSELILGNLVTEETRLNPDELLRQLHLSFLERESIEIQRALDSAQREGNQATVEELLIRKHELTKVLNKLMGKI